MERPAGPVLPKDLKQLFAAACIAELLLLFIAGLSAVRKDPSILADPAQDAAAREAALADSLPGRPAALAPSRLVNFLLDRRYYPENDILVLPDGTHLKGSFPVPAEPALAHTEALYRYCAERGKHFLYVILPGKPQSDADVTAYGVPCARNATADTFRDGLAERGVPCLDIRGLYADDLYDVFYRTDHHWTADAGLRAASAILEALDRDFGYSFDVSALDPSACVRQVIPDLWVGELGQKTIGDLAGRDDLVLLSPKAYEHLRFRDYARDEDRSGGFEILTDPGALTAAGQTPYYTYLSNNDIVEIDNEDAPEGNLLLVKDSFALAMVPFLAGNVSHITAWDMRKDLNIYDYLDAHPETETVLVAYTLTSVSSGPMHDFRRAEAPGA